MISGTITDASGRILSGQTVEAFWNSVRHARPLSIGLNCALGAALMRPYIAELAKVADAFVSVYPNAGLPNPMSDTGFDETPEHHVVARQGVRRGRLRQLRRRLLRHDAGPHRGDREGGRRRAAATDRGGAAARGLMDHRPLRLSGLEPFTIGADSLFVNVGERTNVTGSKAFARMILEERFDGRARGRAPAGRERRADHRRQHGRGDARLEGGDGPLPEPRSRPSPTSRACRS